MLQRVQRRKTLDRTAGNRAGGGCFGPVRNVLAITGLCRTCRCFRMDVHNNGPCKNRHFHISPQANKRLGMVSDLRHTEPYPRYLPGGEHRSDYAVTAHDIRFLATHTR